MQINCTVIIQALNFLITYLFLRSLLLRPLVNIINQKKLAKQIIISKLKEKEANIQKMMENKNQELDDFKETMAKKYQAPQVLLPKIESDILGKEEVIHSAELIQEVRGLIIKGISDAF